LLSCHQNAGQNHDIKVGNGCSENVAQFTYLGTTITDQNLIQDEIKRRVNSGNACYHSVQNLLFSCVLSKSKTIRIYKNMILPVVLYGCETWSLTLREEQRLQVSENRRIFGSKGHEVTGGWTKLHNEELHNLHFSPSIIRMIKSRRMSWTGHVARMGEKRKACRILMGRPKGKLQLGEQDVMCGQYSN
jgi:hypothetical protein